MADLTAEQVAFDISALWMLGASGFIFFGVVLRR